MWWRREPKPLGRRGEDAAARYLKKQGYRILERNRFLGKYEIDIIAREGDTIAFVEVRTRKVLDDFPPEDSVGPRKQQHIRSAAQRYIDQGFGMVMLAPDRVAMSSYVKAEAARLTGWSPMKPVAAPSGGGY